MNTTHWASNSGWLAVGALLLTLGNGTVACSDDEKAGSGGKAGTAGSAGVGGASGAAPDTGTSDSSTMGDALSDAGSKRALATIQSRSGSTLSGSALFTQSGASVTVKIDLQGVMPAGKRGVHIHQNGTCGAADGGATEAGGHWNPADASHGSWEAASHHLGDIGNFDILADGTGSLTFTTDLWSIGTGSASDVIGHAMVVHAIEDTLQPDASFGPRVGCGVIAASP